MYCSGDIVLESASTATILRIARCSARGAVYRHCHSHRSGGPYFQANMLHSHAGPFVRRPTFPIESVGLARLEMPARRRSPPCGIFYRLLRRVRPPACSDESLQLSQANLTQCSESPTRGTTLMFGCWEDEWVTCESDSLGEVSGGPVSAGRRRLKLAQRPRCGPARCESRSDLRGGRSAGAITSTSRSPHFAGRAGRGSIRRRRSLFYPRTRNLACVRCMHTEKGTRRSRYEQVPSVRGGTSLGCYQSRHEIQSL